MMSGWLIAAALCFNIADFGAQPDGRNCTAAFSNAVAACAQAGGGRVVVPAGKWLSGAIRLQSNVELHLADDAEIVFSQDPNDYLPAVKTSWEGIECVNYCPLVYAYGCTNVAVTGQGTLRAYEGDWTSTLWGAWASVNALAARRQLYDWGATDCPVEQREIWKLPDARTRPHFVQFNRCRDVRLEGLKIRNSPFWTIHLYLCEDVVARDLDVVARARNNDGIDIEMTKNVLVERCSFDQGDDTFVLKAGRNRDAWRLATPTENVEIRNCHLRRAHSFFCCGSEVSGGIRNVWIHDCSVGQASHLCYLKTNRRRGGFIENIRCENLRAEECRTALAIETDVTYDWSSFPDYELCTTRIGDILLRNVSVGRCDARVDITGDGKLPVRGVRLQKVKADWAQVGDRFVNCEQVVDDGRPVLSAKVYPITDFGATSEDATDGLRRAIQAADAAGGGCVQVPGGTWLTGPIELPSNVELSVHSTARLLFRDNPALYLRPDGSYRPPISVVRATNVRISSGFFGIVQALTDGWRDVEPSKRPPLVALDNCTGVCFSRVSLRNTPSEALVVAKGTDRLTVTSVELVGKVEEEGFVVARSCPNLRVKGCSFWVGDGKLPVTDPSMRKVRPTLVPGTN